MKKTLMVLSFALCATFAFAQTNKSVSNNKTIDRTTTFDPKAELVEQTAGFNGSIFTKDDDVFNCTFAASGEGTVYTFGVIGNGSSSDDIVDGTTLLEHQCTDYHGSWHRIADTTVATWSSQNMSQEWYPVLVSRFGNLILNNFSSENPNDGFAMMSMIDDYAGWGGTGAVNDYDAYIKFQGFSTLNLPKLRARFYQFYRRFNHDRTYIDYRCDSTNGQWRTIQINSSYVSNSTYSSYVAYTLPSIVLNNPNVELRYRWVDESGSHNGGYFNIIDDFSVIIADVQYIRHASNQMFEGFYHMMPKDFKVPVVWVHEFANEGQTAANNVIGGVYTAAEGQPATALVTRNFGTVQPDDIVYSMIVDPLGWYDSTSDSHQLYYENTPFHTAHRTGNYAPLPTTNTGFHYVYTDFSSSFSSHAYGDTATYDTIFYNVNWSNTGHPHGVWAHDHGVIRRDSYYASGLINSNTFSTEPDDTKWNEAGYGVYNMYVFGKEQDIPEGWRILGVELTPSTYENMAQAGARIEPSLVAVWPSDEQEGYYVRSTVETGASSHVVTSSEVLADQDRMDLQYELYGSDYNPTITLWFPNQPEIDTSITWYIGYQLVEEGNFAVSTCGSYYFDENDEVVYFSDVQGMEHYSTTLSRTNPYGSFVHDPYDGGFHWFGSPTQYPMIRMLIGPAYEIETTTITLECDDPDKGYFANGADEMICDSTVAVALGGGATFYFYAQPGYEVDQILIDGVATNDYETAQDANGDQYGTIRVENVDKPTTLKCIFKEKGEGFDPLSNHIHMNLQPNPASTNVHISLNGVSGNVNMSIIDMSGRVISTSQFNAENGTDVNVSNLAKGAYFVRITNNTFSKVEKLIVR